MEARQSPPSRSTAFISYSRHDAEFAKRLLAGLQSLEIDAYMDRKDIAPGEAWRDRLGKLIAASDAVVFVLTPYSASSEVCRWEAEQAHDLGKRLLPVIRSDLAGQNAPELLTDRNYIFSRSENEFADALPVLADAIARDIDIVREQTRISQLAHDWANKGRSVFGLLRGDALIAAEGWQDNAAHQRVSVGKLLIEFIARSRQQFDADETARARLVTEAFRFQSDQLATMSDQALRNNDPVTALYLAIASAPDMTSRLEESRTRPLTLRSVAALSNARRCVTAFEFLDPGERAGIDKLHASPDGAFFCGAVQNVVKLFAGSAPFRILAQRECPDAVLDICFSGNSKRVAVLLDGGSAGVLVLPDLTPRYGHAWADAKTVALDWHGGALCAEGDGQLHAVLEEGGTVSLGGGRTRSASDDGSLLGALRYETAISSSQAVEMRPLGDEGSICLALDPQANVWIAGHGNRASLRSIDPDSELLVLPLAPDSCPVAAIFSADGKTFMLEEKWAQRNCWTIWSIAGEMHTRITSTPPDGRARRCALSADGAYLVTVEGTELKRWDARSGRLLNAESLPGRLNQWAMNPELLVSTSPKGDLVALLLDSTDANESNRPHQVVVYRFHDGSRTVEHALSPFAAEGAYGIAWSSAADWFAAYGHSSSVVVQAIHDVRINRRLEHDGSRIDDGVRWAAFGQDGRLLVTGSCDRTAKVWDVQSGALLADVAHPREVRRTAFSRDGLFVLTVDDAGVLRAFPTGQDKSVLEMQLPQVQEMWVGSKSNLYVRVAGRLHVLPALLGIDRLFEDCCRVLPRGLTGTELLRLGLSPDTPDWNIRHRKWPALLGESPGGLVSIGGVADMVRRVTVEPARAIFRRVLDRHVGASADQLAEFGLIIWGHYAAALRELSDSYNLSVTNIDFEIAAEIFDALVEAAEEYRAPELPTAMVARYRGPAGGKFERWRRS